MTHPLLKKIPPALNRKIRWRLRLAAARKYCTQKPLWLAGALVPVAVVLFLITQPDAEMPASSTELELVAEIREVQAREQANATSGIYYTKRLITEGRDKPAFVTAVTGEVVAAPVRTDVVETWQHNDTALALIESNGTSHSLEAFLTRERGEAIALYHFGTDDQVVSRERVPYDEAHDLATLYTDYTSLERPSIPVLPTSATFTEIDASGQFAHFNETVSDTIVIEHVVDVDTKLLTETIIYVSDDAGNRFEMSRITYEERAIVPADQLESIFNEDQLDFTLIS